MLMVRYNAAHPGAEQDIFPHVDRQSTALISYTATRWRKLLKRPRGWTGDVPTAADCKATASASRTTRSTSP